MSHQSEHESEPVSLVCVYVYLLFASSKSGLMSTYLLFMNTPIDWHNDKDNDSSIYRARNLLKQVQPRKASGPDRIHSLHLVLKNCAFGLAYPLGTAG